MQRGSSGSFLMASMHENNLVEDTRINEVIASSNLIALTNSEPLELCMVLIILCFQTRKKFIGGTLQKNNSYDCYLLFHLKTG